MKNKRNLRTESINVEKSKEIEKSKIQQVCYQQQQLHQLGPMQMQQQLHQPSPMQMQQQFQWIPMQKLQPSLMQQFYPSPMLLFQQSPIVQFPPNLMPQAMFPLIMTHQMPQPHIVMPTMMIPTMMVPTSMQYPVADISKEKTDNIKLTIKGL